MNELFKTERVRIKDLVPHVKNPRKIKAEAKKALWEKIQKFGMIGIPVRDFDGMLLSGHQRCELYATNGLGDYEVDVRSAVRKLTDQELHEVMMIENTHSGEFDLQILKQEFESMIDLKDFGFDLAELDKQLNEVAQAGAEQVAELPVVAKFSEKYDSIVIVCSNEIDLNHLSEKLGLDRAQCYKSSKVGSQHVIDAKQAIAAFTK